MFIYSVLYMQLRVIWGFSECVMQRPMGFMKDVKDGGFMCFGELNTAGNNPLSRRNKATEGVQRLRAA